MGGSSNRNKMVRCKICAKSIRSDVVTRHNRTHKDVMSTEESREELQAHHVTDLRCQEKQQEVCQEGVPLDLCTDVVSSSPVALADIDFKDFLLHNARVYRESIGIGRQVADILNEGVVPEESLPKEYKDALDLYRMQKPQINLKTVQLREWQQQLLDKLKRSKRQVIWVTGSSGNEGKSWFQGYLETSLGYDHVVRLDICDKSSNIFCALARRPLQTTDIFVFNHARSQDNPVNYNILEHIKDGCAPASQVIKFKTPNMVIVFSNHPPDRSRLSKDRWREYFITSTGELQKAT